MANGGMGGSGGTTTSVGGAAGGAPEAAVPCGDPSNVCGPGQVCCFHEVSVDCDHCASAPTCFPYTPAGKEPCTYKYHRLRCDNSDDCAPGASCCAQLAVDPESNKYPYGSSCSDACDSGYVVLCDPAKGGSDCPAGAATCTPMAYAGYSYCSP